MLIIIDDLLFLTFQQSLRIKRTGLIPRKLLLIIAEKSNLSIL